MAIDIIIANRVGPNRLDAGGLKQDGVYLYPIVTTGDEYRYKVEVWQKGKMLFPTFDESIGRKNLINGSADGSWENYTSDTTVVTNVGDDIPNTIRVEGITPGAGVLGARQTSMFRTMKLSSANKYTFSVLARGNVHSLNYTYLMNNPTPNQNIGRMNLNGESFVRLSTTFTPLSSSDTSSGSYMLVAYNGERNNRWFEFKEPKLELGLVDSAYTPAPNELLRLAIITVDGCSYRIEDDEIVLYDFTEESGVLKVQVSYGSNWVRSNQVSWKYDLPYVVINGLKWMKENLVKEDGSPYFNYYEAEAAALAAGYRLPTHDEMLPIREWITWDEDLKGAWMGHDHELKSESKQSVFFPALGQYPWPGSDLFDLDKWVHSWLSQIYVAPNAQSIGIMSSGMFLYITDPNAFYTLRCIIP